MLNETVVSIFKLASTFAVSSGVSTMVGFAAKSSVPKVAPLLIRSRPMLSGAYHLFQKVAIPAGAAALAGMAAEQAVKYTERQIDDNVALFNKASSYAEKTAKTTKGYMSEPTEAE